MITIETADNALKSFYLDAVTEALNLKVNPLLAKIGQSTADVVGKDVRKLVKVGVSGGIGAGTETGDLPSASETKRVQFVSTLKNLYGTIEISDKALRASATNEGAFVDNKKDIQDWDEDHELKKLGEAYAKAAAEFLGLEKKAVEPAPAPAPVEPEKKYIYRVQVGAYSNLSGAEKQLADLRAAGFGGIIVKSEK